MLGAKIDKTIEVARHFSWVSFFIIIISSIFLTILLGRSMQTSFMDSQKEYVSLLADNFNTQLFRRFTLPIAYTNTNISLSDPDQFRLLDETVESMISGLQITNIRILDKEGNIVYSNKEDEILTKALSLQNISRVYSLAVPYIFEERSYLPYYQAFFQKKIDEDTFLLDILYPLSVEKSLENLFEEVQLLGVLQVSVDVSSYYQKTIDFQRSVFLILSVSSLVLFLLLQYIIRRAEVLVAERIEHNKKLEAQLHQQEKLASMGRVVASIAHEIRNPLGIIQSSTEFLASKNKDKMDNLSSRILTTILDEIKRLTNVVNDFLDYARPRKPKNQEVNLSFSINKAITFLENKIKTANIELEVEVPEKVIVYGEEELLYRAIYNLISNAIQAIEEQEDAKLLVKVEDESEENIRIFISDNGAGFSEEAIAKALDPFFTTKEEGTGLGLPIVCSIIEAHSGRVSLYNNQSGGACVELALPKREKQEKL